VRFQHIYSYTFGPLWLLERRGIMMMGKARTVILLVLAGCLPAGTKASCLDFFSQQLRIAIKRFIYGGLAFSRSPDVEAGIKPPLVQYEWENTIFIHWHILPEEVPFMEARLSLLEGLSFVPVTVLLDETIAKYTLSLCVRKVEDTVQFDFLTYVMSSEDTKPHLMVIESRSSVETFTPLGLVEAASLKLEVDNERLVFEDVETKSSFVVEIAGVPQNTRVHRDFSRSFDKMYYKNGVYSRVFSNGSLAQAKPMIFDGNLLLENFDISRTQWGEFVEQDPFSAVYFPNTIVLGAELWTNCQVVDNCLVSSRKSLYDEAEYLGIFTGFTEPNVRFAVTTDKPSYFLAFKIRDEKQMDFIEYVGLPKDIQLSPMRLRENGPSEVMLALNIYSATIEGISDGLRAEWNTFFLPDGGTSDDPRIIVVQAESNADSFDPVNLFTSPVKSFEHKDENGATSSSYTISRGWFQEDITFSLSYPTPEICDNTTLAEPNCDSISAELTFSNDAVYWGNLIADRGLFNDVLGIPVRVVAPSQIAFDISKSGWAPFVEAEVLDFFVFNPVEIQYFLNPMYNLEEIGCGWCDYFPFFCF